MDSDSSFNNINKNQDNSLKNSVIRNEEDFLNDSEEDSLNNSIKKEPISKRTYKNFLIIYSGQLSSLLGSSTVQFMLIWWITLTTRDPNMLALAGFFSFLPNIFIAPIAVVFADRHSKKKIMIITDTMQALFTLILIYYFYIDYTPIWIVIVVLTARSTSQAIQQPANAALIPLMVPKKEYTRINGIQFLFNGLINIIGPVIGAFLLVYINIDNALWIDIITFLGALVCIVPITIPEPESVKNRKKIKKSESESFITQFKEGIKTIKSIPGIIDLAVLAIFANFLIIGFDTLLPYFVNVRHNGTASDFALVMVAFQISSVLMALYISVKGEIKHKELIFISGLYVIYFSIFIMALSPIGWIWYIALTAALISAGVPLMNTSIMTILQERVPVEKMGRISSILNAMAQMVMPLGVLISGPIASYLGVNWYYIIIGIIGSSFTFIYSKKASKAASKFYNE